MTFQIETNVPMPTKPGRSGSSKYPFAEMSVGDSFVVELAGRASWAFIYRAITSAQNKHGIKLTTRLIESDKRRVWRTA